MDWDRRDGEARDDDNGPSVAEHVDDLCEAIREHAHWVLEGLQTDRVPMAQLRLREAALRDALKALCRDLGVKLRDDNGRPLL